MRVALAAERSRTNAAAVSEDDLTIGKQADLIVVDTRRPHLHPLNDPVATIVMNAGPSDVDTVIVDGEIVKSGGLLVGAHADRAFELVAASNERLVAPSAVDAVPT